MPSRNPRGRARTAMTAGVAGFLQKHQQVAEDAGRPEERFRYGYGHN